MCESCSRSTRDPIAITVSGYVLGPHGWMLTFAALAFTCLAVAAPLLDGRSPRRPGSARHKPWPPSPPAGYLLFWLTALLDAQLGGLFGDRSATGLGERVMAAAFVVWLVTATIDVRRLARR